MDPGSEKGFFPVSDPGFQTHIFESLERIFWVKSTIILREPWITFFFFSCSIMFCDIRGYKNKKKAGQQIFPPPLWLQLLDPRSGIDKNQDPGSG